GLVADEASDGGGGAAGAGAHHHPARNREALALQLAEHAFGDVVVAAPVCRPLGEGELVEIVALDAIGELSRLVIGLPRLDLGGLAAIELDLGDLLPGRAMRDDGDEG